MAGKIFYRERIKVGEKEKKPRFKLVAVADVNITFFPASCSILHSALYRGNISLR